MGSGVWGVWLWILNLEGRRWLYSKMENIGVIVSRSKWQHEMGNTNDHGGDVLHIWSARWGDAKWTVEMSVYV